MQYDIFLSYRREGGYETAKHLYDLLTRDGYSVSFDIDTLKQGDFDRQLLNRIDACKDFILIVDSHCFERTLNGCPAGQDWLRCELAHALLKGKNIIPVFLAGVAGFPSQLPDDINQVSTKNGPKYNRDYFDAFYHRLKEDFLLAKPSILDSNRFTLKKAFGITSVVMFLIALIVYACLCITNQNKLVRKFDSLVSVADSIIVQEQRNAQDDTTLLSFNTKNIVQATSIYVEAINLHIKDTARINESEARVRLLKQIIDSCQAYEANMQRMQQYMLEQRIASAEILKNEQTELLSEINTLIKQL